MITDLALLRERIGTAPATVVTPLGLTCLGYTPNLVQPPSFYPGEIEFDRTARGHRTFGAQRSYMVTATACTSLADDKSGQEMLDKLLSEGGTYDLIGAIEADKTLGGVCDDLNVEQVDGYRIYTFGNQYFYGARMRILVLG